MTDDINTGQTEPCLGLSWSNLVNNRFLIARSNSSYRTFKVQFSSNLPVSSCNFHITKEGISWLARLYIYICIYKMNKTIQVCMILFFKTTIFNIFFIYTFQPQPGNGSVRFFRRTNSIFLLISSSYNDLHLS